MAEGVTPAAGPALSCMEPEASSSRSPADTASRTFLALGALSAASSVVLGAATAHAPDAQLAASLPLFQTALQYHQFHALGLVTVGLVAARLPASRCFVWSGWLMVVGTLLFSGNLYLRSIAGIHDFHAVTPYGGGAFIVAWLLFAVGVLAQPKGSTAADKNSDG